MKLITNLICVFDVKNAAALILAVLLTACGGDDGEPGNPGEPGGPPATDISSLNVKVDEVIFTHGVATVNYSVNNQDDEPVVGIPSSTYIAAQLLPQGFTNAGNTSQWQYFTSESCTSSCTGELVDHKNGKYSYTFSAAFDGMNEMSYMPGATQRLVIKIGGDSLPDGTALPTTNQNFDWQDSGEVAYARNLISMETCNTCHNDLAFHGSKYNEIETCVTCHSEGKVSSNDHIFPQMIHGKHLTGFPGSLADCQTCHVNDETLTENMNWARVPGMEACGSCHTDINFPAGEGHPAQVDNSNCVACHNSDWTMSVHDGGNDEALAQFNAQITAASLSGTTVTFSIKLSNPESGEVYTDSADKLNFISRLGVETNWGTSFDYSSNSAKRLTISSETPDSGADGIYTYQVTGLTIPTGSETDRGAIVVKGSICANGNQLADCEMETSTVLVLQASHQFFDATNITATGRRVVVTNETCSTCHVLTQLKKHSGERNDAEAQCQLCHNNFKTADETAQNPQATSSDYKHLAHTLHAGMRSNYADIKYPGDIGNCAQCHIEDENGVLSAALPLDSAVQPLMLNDGSFTSPTAAICSACHTSDSAKNHMTQQGAVFMGTEEDATSGTESCATCHGQGATADVLTVHPMK